MTHPAGAIARLEAYLARRRKSSQTEYGDIHGYDAGCATEAVLLASDIEALIAALTRANAATAAAYEVAALAIMEKCHDDMDREEEAAIVRALATPDQTAALDRLIAEAVGPYVDALHQIADQTDGVTPEPDNLQMAIGSINSYVRAIIAASKKGGA